ncbi:MAG: MarR family transcriptional regulator [Chloroflexota bacterium]|nr:MarR family transcriptional regulator [Chloroflexota bacterium]MDE2940807.1 MarR family transcriptional regulator [Chloroflexota bacterium]MDE3267603.1 MarR family transcriptional regulator [Chloroflexota bacterium]
MVTDLRDQYQEVDPQVTERMATNLGPYIMDLLNAFASGISDEAAPHDITSLEYSLLRFCLAEGECTATQLAQVLPVDASRISRVVSRLVDMEILQRRRVRDDRRVVLLSLTETGRDLINELQRRVTAFNVRLLAGVSREEMIMCRSVADRILANYAAMKQSSR